MKVTQNKKKLSAHLLNEPNILIHEQLKKRTTYAEHMEETPDWSINVNLLH